MQKNVKSSILHTSASKKALPFHYKKNSFFELA